MVIASTGIGPHVRRLLLFRQRGRHRAPDLFSAYRGSPLNPPISIAGITRVELIIIIACLSFLGVLLLSQMYVSKAQSKRMVCVDNMRRLALAINFYSIDLDNSVKGQPFSLNGLDKPPRLINSQDLPHYFQILSNELSSPTYLSCPLDKTRAPANKWQFLTNTNISYFLNVEDVFFINKTRFFLSGDCNFLTNNKPVQSGILNLNSHISISWNDSKPFKRHGNRGNLIRPDGSLTTLDTAGLQHAMISAFENTNTIIIP